MSSTYTTRSGDTWDAISHRNYGSEFYMHVLLDANPDHRYVAMFDEGVDLVVPDLPEAERSDSLPPWRRP